jgi:hypothetical protein
MTREATHQTPPPSAISVSGFRPAERVLNHVQPGVAGVYDRFAYLDEKRAALEKWSDHLVALGDTKAGKK